MVERSDTRRSEVPCLCLPIPADYPNPLLSDYANFPVSGVHLSV